jgi:peptidoglycan-N-acetylmuramic acid deacetylase
MMMRKFMCGLVAVCLMITLFTGCEPNVTDDDNNALDTSVTGANNATGTSEVTGENGLDTADENGIDTNGEPGLNGTTDDNEPAVGDNTLTADFALLSANTASAAQENDFTHLPNKKIGWGLGSETDERNRPLDAIKANKDFKSFGGVFIGPREPVIYLTFDEGYENGCTPAILDTLKAKNVRATFFVTYDYCKKVPELVRRMIDEGHTIGNHSYSHPSFPDCSVEKMQSEIMKLHDHVKQTFGYEMNLIRFPMGEFSQRSLAVAQDLGYTSVFWSFAYMDWNVNSQPDPAASLAKIKSATHPGAIVLLHAVSRTNAEILGAAVDYWLSEGYRLGIIESAPEGAFSFV